MVAELARVDASVLGVYHPTRVRHIAGFDVGHAIGSCHRAFDGMVVFVHHSGIGIIEQIAA